jgi:hypothetical protein
MKTPTAVPTRARMNNVQLSSQSPGQSSVFFCFFLSLTGLHRDQPERTASTWPRSCVSGEGSA